MGSTPPFFTRCTNSVASSIMVKSAAVSVSNTSSKPRRRRAATILPSTLVPMGRPKHSPKVARTLGAVCTTTCFVGVVQGSPHLAGVVLLGQGAGGAHGDALPAGDAGALAQLAPQRRSAMCVWKPRSLAPMTPTRLVLAAGGHAAAAQDALVVVANHVRGGCRPCA